MASNRRKTVIPAIRQEPACQASSSFSPGAASMARTDSGYYSNLSNLPSYYENPGPVLEEVAEDYQGADTAMNFDYQYNMEGVEATYEQQQYSDYIVEGAGSHMSGYYQDDSIPRTSMVDHDYEQSQDMDLDGNSDPYFKVEESQWPAQNDPLQQYPHAAYEDHAHSSTMSPVTTETVDASSAPFYGREAPRTVPSTTPAHRHRLPSKKPSTNKSQTSTEDKRQTALASAQMSATTAATSTTNTTNKYQCLADSCNRQFNRTADLDRHMKFIHCKASVPPMLCDYRRCSRHKTPFHRADHFRDHLRDQHKEDLLKRGETGPPDAAWWRGRLASAVYSGWWRCSKCFARVHVERDGWRCGGSEEEGAAGCGNYCEVERQVVRRLPIECDHLDCEIKGEGERETWPSPLKFREHLREVHREDVPVREGKDGEKELMDDAWWASRDPAVGYTAKWRCTRCLDAVDSSVDGFVCSRCGFECEEVRKGWHGAF